MSGLRAGTKKQLALGLVIVFMAGWLFFSYYLYTNQVLFVSIEGTILDFEATTLALYRGQVDPNIKAVILYLDTPGGLVYPCLEIATHVQELADEKPVIAVMGTQCASGGYYIASFASYIYTHMNTITGGIGVISVWVDLSEYYEKEGIKIWVWQTGEEKDMGAEWRSPTQEENASIQAEVDALFMKLITDISVNRNLSNDTVTDISTGAVFLGREAQALGLVDAIGNPLTAQAKAAAMAGLWRFITVSQDMSDAQKFLRAMF